MDCGPRSQAICSSKTIKTFFRRSTIEAVQSWNRPDRWQSPAGRMAAFLARPSLSRRSTQIHALPIPGIQFGNVFVGIQPSRGYDLDPTSQLSHSRSSAPTHSYLGFYHWLRHHFQADAFVHVGKHGNLEWLPGKGIALSENCYPEAAFGPMPHFYPFIVNDPW